MSAQSHANEEPTPALRPMTLDPKTPRVLEWPHDSHLWTWKQIAFYVLKHLRSAAPLTKLYELIETHPRTKGLAHWQAKVRQQLQAGPEFVRVADGTWGLSSQYKPAEIARYARSRRKRWPLLGKRETPSK